MRRGSAVVCACLVGMVATAQTTSLLPHQNFVREQIPVVVADAKVPTNAAGPLIPWRGHAWFEGLVWCSAWERQDSERSADANDDTSTLYDIYLMQGDLLISKNRSLRGKAGSQLVTPVMDALADRMKSDPAMKGKSFRAACSALSEASPDPATL